MANIDPQESIQLAIQKVATGPEYSKNLNYEETYQAMQYILSDGADPVQAGIFLIALRMKRETLDEYKGVLQAIVDTANTATVDVDELVDIADPYDGHSRGLPVVAFVAPVLAACGLPAVTHGLEYIGPKYGITQRKVLRAAGVNVDLSSAEAAKALENDSIGWAYVDQRACASRLYHLLDLRRRMIKRSVLTTVETLIKPLQARGKTYTMTGYVHKAYPPIYAELARFRGFDSAMIVRGVEGGVIPSLQQEAKLFFFEKGGQETEHTLNPTDMSITQTSRAVPLPKDLPAAAAGSKTEFDIDAGAKAAAEAGMEALQGKAGSAYDCLVYSASICLHSLGRSETLAKAAETVRKILDSGAALTRLEAARN
ncbi:Anthranilate phosphoribosyltransferase like [hydrothermal vent metagenome]|uniref:Anthranilate phosphoribosyltransferase like n=1 Tax=hydrothermal vent metagenome TaxID=652676 RepID=A0A3B1BR96_9ZZZZ